jgi:transposase-like protein
MFMGRKNGKVFGTRFCTLKVKIPRHMQYGFQTKLLQQQAFRIRAVDAQGP